MWRIWYESSSLLSLSTYINNSSKKNWPTAPCKHVEIDAATAAEVALEIADFTDTR
jgi:hypothetical protein